MRLLKRLLFPQKHLVVIVRLREGDTVFRLSTGHEWSHRRPREKHNPYRPGQNENDFLSMSETLSCTM